MASALEFHIKSYVSTAAIVAYVCVKKDAATDNVVVATAADVPIGVTMSNAAAGTVVPVRLFNGPGTAFFKANAAIAKNAVVRCATAGGLIDDSTTGTVVGTAEGAATAQNDVIEVLLAGASPAAMTADAGQAVATDLATALVSLNLIRLALISQGIIKGAA